MALSAHPVTLAIVVEVSDTGVGVPDDNWGRLTEPFVRGESNPYKSQERVGLGLSIVRSLVTLNGGALTIKAKLVWGPRYWCRFRPKMTGAEIHFHEPCRCSPEVLNIEA